jgi:DNA-binding transcriptional LysR family regulator
MLTLRQIEVIRAVMLTGTIAGAARLLNVAAPGLSRLMKHTEDSLGAKLFSRRGGRFVPAPEARSIFAQINELHRNLENLQFAIGALERGEGAEFKFGATPSIAHVMAPLAVADLRRRYPDLLIDLDVLKIEDAIDFLLLGRGEVAAVSSRVDHPAITFEPLAEGQLYCIVAEEHPLASRARIAAAEIAALPLIGIEPRDPYGAIITNIFARARLQYQSPIKARFGVTVCALVRQNLGIGVIDGFTLAEQMSFGLRVIPIEEDTTFRTYVAFRNDTTLSSVAEFFIAALRARMKKAHEAMTAHRGRSRQGENRVPRRRHDRGEALGGRYGTE